MTTDMENSDGHGTSSNGTFTTTTTTELAKTLQSRQIGIIVGVLLSVLVITAVVLFILLKKRTKQKRRQSSKQTGGSGVYEATTAPIEDEGKAMLKNGESHELKEKGPEKADSVEEKNGGGGKNEADANESSAVLINNDGNAMA